MTRFLLTVLTVIFSINSSVAAEFESPTMNVSASDFLAANLLKGKYHTTDENVTIDGYIDNYTVDSEFGQFAVAGNLALKKLIRELDAIAELKSRTTTGTSTAAVVGAVSDTGKSLVQIATDPTGTAKGVSGGVSRFFKRTSRSAKNLANKTSDSSSENDEISGDDETSEETEKESNAETDDPEVSQQIAEGFLGVGKAQRELAMELEVDPYTRNEVLQEELHRVASISGTVGKVTKLLMPMPTFLSAAKNVSNLVWNLSPMDLLIHNEEKLKALGYTKKEVNAFFSNQVYTPTQQTVLVATLEALDKVEGRELFLGVATSTESPTEAGSIIQSALFTQLYHENIMALTKLLRVPEGMLPLAVTENDTAILFAPLDYIMWTEEAAEAIARFDILIGDTVAVKEKQLWVQGRVSTIAASRLKEAGWVVSTGGFKKLETMIDNQETSG